MEGDTHQSLTMEVCLQTELVSKPWGPQQANAPSGSFAPNVSKQLNT